MVLSSSGVVPTEIQIPCLNTNLTANLLLYVSDRITAFTPECSQNNNINYY